MDSSGLNPQVSKFLIRNKCLEHSYKFLGMSLLIFAGLPRSTLRALGLPADAIRNHAAFVTEFNAPVYKILQKHKTGKRDDSKEDREHVNDRYDTALDLSNKKHRDGEQANSFDAIREYRGDQLSDNPASRLARERDRRCNVRDRSPECAYRTPAVARDILDVVQLKYS